MPSKKINRLDRAGIIVSLLCALHCSALPVLLSLLPFAGLAFLQNPWIELLIICTSLTIAAASLVRSYRQHHKALPLLVVSCGFLLVLIGHGPLIHAEWLWLTCGGLLITVAHLLNWRMHYTCAHPH